MKFLLAQINPIVGDLEGNAKKILNIASKASSISADIVLTPELSLWGYPANDLLFKKNLINNQYKILEELSKIYAFTITYVSNNPQKKHIENISIRSHLLKTLIDDLNNPKILFNQKM